MNFKDNTKINKSWSIFNNKGIISLDLLRGIAAFLGVIPHYFLYLGHHSKVFEFSAIFAVEIFFILSGYVLGPQLHKIFKYPTYLNLKVFYLRRWMRTIPIYLIIMLSIAIITPNISFNNIIGYLFFTKTWIKIPENNEFFIPAWSLAIEEWFYLIFPLILIIFSFFKKKQVYTILCFLLIFFLIKIFSYTALFTENDNIRRITFLRLDAIAYGYLTYYFTRSITTLSAFKKKFLWLLIPICILINYQLFLQQMNLSFIYFSTVTAILILISFRYTNIYY